MKLELTRGCVCDFLGIDDIPEYEMTDEQRKEYFDKIVQELPKLDSGWFNYFLQWICEEFGEYKDLGRCNQCGDFIESYTIEI